MARNTNLKAGRVAVIGFAILVTLVGSTGCIPGLGLLNSVGGLGGLTGLLGGAGGYDPTDIIGSVSDYRSDATSYWADQWDAYIRE